MAKSLTKVVGKLADGIVTPTNATLTFGKVFNGGIVNSSQQLSLYQLSDFADTVTGTSAGEAIYAYDSNDRVDAGGGDDLVDGGNGNDTLYGGAGQDDLRGGAGNDFLDGGADADVMRGGSGNDRYVVGAYDVVQELAGEGTDTVMTNEAFYQLGTNFENLEFFVNAGSGPINFTGYGNGLNNLLVGNFGNDTLAGFEGNDTLDGGAGADMMYGGPGNDTYIVDNVGDRVLESSSADGIDTILTSLSSYSMNAVAEILTYTGSGNFVGQGNGNSNVLTGGAGNDSFFGNVGFDTIYGGAGNDTIDGGGHVDHLIGGAGDDTYMNAEAGDVIIEDANGGYDQLIISGSGMNMPANVEKVSFANDNAHVVNGNASNNMMIGAGGADSLRGFDGNDTINGNGGDDALEGGAGNDSLSGGAGNDYLAGQEGSDKLYGGDGNDVLLGLAGPDDITGGAGSDTFKFTSADGGSADYIRDFTPGVDKIDFSNIDGNVNLAGDQQLAFAFMGDFVGGGQGSVRYDIKDGYTLLSVDFNGDKVIDTQIYLLGQTSILQFSDFIM
jgi:Ca2+-binding RTX toxin-like protein